MWEKNQQGFCKALHQHFKSFENAIKNMDSFSIVNPGHSKKKTLDTKKDFCSLLLKAVKNLRIMEKGQESSHESVTS